MTIREHIIDIAKLSRNYQDFWAKLKIRLGPALDLVRPELPCALWAKELQRRENA